MPRSVEETERRVTNIELHHCGYPIDGQHVAWYVRRSSEPFDVGIIAEIVDVSCVTVVQDRKCCSFTWTRNRPCVYVIRVWRFMMRVVSRVRYCWCLTGTCVFLFLVVMKQNIKILTAQKFIHNIFLCTLKFVLTQKPITMSFRKLLQLFTKAHRRCRRSIGHRNRLYLLGFLSGFPSRALLDTTVVDSVIICASRDIFSSERF